MNMHGGGNESITLINNIFISKTNDLQFGFGVGNTDVFKFLDNLGYTYKSNAIMNNNNNTLITDSLLGVKRIYSLEDYNHIYDKIGEYDCSSLDILEIRQSF